MSDQGNDQDPKQHLDPTPGRQTEFERQASTAVAIAEAVAETEARVLVTQTLNRRSRGFIFLLAAMLGISLILHAITLTRLFAIRNTLKTEIGRLADSVVAAKDQTLRYDLPIDQEIPVNLSIPIRQNVDIPVNTSVRIQQDITIPIDTGFGSIDLPVPLDVNIPISTVVPLNFEQDIPISTTLPVKLNVPIQLDLSSSQFAEYLDQLHDSLLRFRDEF